MNPDNQTNSGNPGDRVIIRTTTLGKEYPMGGEVTVALRDISLIINRGEFISVMGPSGSGKSTFFNMVGALDAPTSGHVYIDEADVAQLTAVELAFLRCQRIGYVFQQYDLIPYMTALENVVIPMTFAGVNADESRHRGMALLDLVGLADRWSHRPIEMSGGQQQRVAIARSMANEPMLLLCDEPTANLDFATGAEVIRILQKLNTDRLVTIICATHDHRLIDICDRLVWIRDGRVEKIQDRASLNVELGSYDAIK